MAGVTEHPAIRTIRKCAAGCEKISLFIVNSKQPVYILYSNSRLNYGVGSRDLIAYRGALSFIYDASKEMLYILEIFVPNSDFKRDEIITMLNSFSITK